jgi:hypothetical protein
LFKPSIEIGLAIGGLILTILLLVLDKAGKLKGRRCIGCWQYAR